MGLEFMRTSLSSAAAIEIALPIASNEAIPIAALGLGVNLVSARLLRAGLLVWCALSALRAQPPWSL